MITWDTTVLPIHTVMFARRNLSRSGGQTIIGVEQVVQSVTDFWQASVGLKIRKPEEVLAYRALQAQNWGRSGEWVIPACSQFGLPQGDFDLSFGDDISSDFPPEVFTVTTYSSATRGARSITFSMAFAPVPGQYFSIGNRLYLISTVTPVATLSRYTVTFAPSLRANVASGVHVEFVMPQCLMRLAQDNIGDLTLDQLRFGDVSLNFIEVPA